MKNKIPLLTNEIINLNNLTFNKINETKRLDEFIETELQNFDISI